MFNKKLITDIDVKGKRVLVRVDFNVPIKDGQGSRRYPHPGCAAHHPVFAGSRSGSHPVLAPGTAERRPRSEIFDAPDGGCIWPSCWAKPVAVRGRLRRPAGSRSGRQGLKAGRGAGAGKHPLLQGRDKERPRDGTSSWHRWRISMSMMHLARRIAPMLPPKAWPVSCRRGRFPDGKGNPVPGPGDRRPQTALCRHPGRGQDQR